MALSTDGTALNSGTGGDVIATEDVPAGSPGRLSPDVPTTDYKIGRSKIALGDYGDDLGDVCAQNPIPVTSAERRMSEMDSLRQSEIARYSLAAQARCRERLVWGDRMDTIDRRGPGGR